MEPRQNQKNSGRNKPKQIKGFPYWYRRKVQTLHIFWLRYQNQLRTRSKITN